MKFSLSLLATFAATAFAQTGDFDPVFTPEKNEEIPAGSTYEITWEAPEKYADGTVSLHLIGGETQDSQVPLADLAAGIPNSAEKYSWAVDASLGEAKVYGLVIKYESDPAIFQYSNPFQIVAGEGEADKGDKTTTISKDYGVKTVTLEECDCEETSTTTPPPAETTTPVYTTPAVNSTSTSTYVKPSSTIITKPAPTITDAPEEPETIPEETPETIPEEGAGARFGASSVALVGAFVVAALAL